MTQRARLLAALLGANLLFLLTAACAGTAEAATPPWFEVEMILFTRPASADSNEQPVFEAGVPEWTRARALQPGVTPPLSRRLGAAPVVSGPGSASGATMPVAYKLLPDSALQLTREAKALRRSRGALAPVLHLAWRQPIVANRAADPLYVQWPTENRSRTPDIQGIIELSINRYLHVSTDILLNERPTRGSETFQLLGDRAGSTRFQAHRRMRSGELHYLDHPRMGLLIEIRRHEVPEPSMPAEETAAPADSEPALRGGPQTPGALPKPAPAE